MRIALSFAFFALLVGAFPLHAEETSGRVRAIYYEGARGVLLDPRMMRQPSAARWVDVELDGQRRALVQLPATMDAMVGDIVAVQLASPKSVEIARADAPIRVSRVIEVRARASQLARP
jgi:hypothetical protein